MRVYVDWEKIELLIREGGADLGKWRGSEISYLSNEMGRPRSTIERVRNAKTTKLSTIGEIATALGCHPVDIISAEGYPDPKSGTLAVH